MEVWDLGPVPPHSSQLMALNSLCREVSALQESHVEGICLNCCIKSFDQSLEDMKRTRGLVDDEKVP
jgi:hypothetical protein